MTKVCKTCKKRKPHSDFDTYHRKPDRHRPHCVVCQNEHRKSRDWQGGKKGWPYKGDIEDADYLSDRKSLFDYHGNGWWWGQGDKEA